MLINRVFPLVNLMGSLFPFEPMTTIESSFFDSDYVAQFSNGDFAFWVISDGNENETVKATLTGSEFVIERGFNDSTILSFTAFPTVCVFNSSSSEALDSSECEYPSLPEGTVPDLVVSAGGVCYSMTIEAFRELLQIPEPVDAEEITLCGLIDGLQETDTVLATDLSVIRRDGECFLVSEGDKCNGQN